MVWGRPASSSRWKLLGVRKVTPSEAMEFVDEGQEVGGLGLVEGEFVADAGGGEPEVDGLSGTRFVRGLIGEA